MEFLEGASAVVSRPVDLKYRVFKKSPGALVKK